MLDHSNFNKLLNNRNPIRVGLGFIFRHKLSVIENIKNDTQLRIDDRRKKRIIENEKQKFCSIMMEFFPAIF